MPTIAITAWRENEEECGSTVRCDEHEACRHTHPFYHSYAGRASSEASEHIEPRPTRPSSRPMRRRSNGQRHTETAWHEGHEAPKKKKIRTLKPATPYICLRAFVRPPPGTIELSEMGTLFSSGHKTLYNWNFEVIFFREHYKIMGIVPARFSGPPDDRKNYENSWTPREGENREK